MNNKLIVKKQEISIAHNDYTTEISPVFEIYSDRIEITSSGGISSIKNTDDFFEGYSKLNPNNRSTYFAKELHTSVKNIERWLKQLKDEDTIEFNGSPKTGGYVVK